MLNVYLLIVYYWKICNISRFRALLQIKFCWLIWLKTYRSSCPEAFCKKGVLRNFAKFTGKHLCQSPFFNKVVDLFFNKVEGIRPVTLLKRGSGAGSFLWILWNFLKNTFSHGTPLVAASNAACSLVRARSIPRKFSVISVISGVFDNSGESTWSFSENFLYRIL